MREIAHRKVGEFMSEKRTTVQSASQIIFQGSVFVAQKG